MNDDYSELRAKHYAVWVPKEQRGECDFCVTPYPCPTIRLLDEVERLRAALVENPCERFVVGCNLVHTDVDDGDPDRAPLPMAERCLRCQVEAALNSSTEEA